MSEEITALSYCKILENLYLKNTKIKDCTALSDCIMLKELFLPSYIILIDVLLLNSHLN